MIFTGHLDVCVCVCVCVCVRARARAGEMLASVHFKVMIEYQSVLQPGSVLVLHQVRQRSSHLTILYVYYIVSM